MNTVTFETAKRLKDAGFPQPKPAPGQFWYNGKDELLCIQNTSDDTAHFFGVGNNRFVFNASFAHLFDALFFAPQAHDILALDDSLKFWYSNIEKAFVCKIWVIADSRLTSRIITDENPHEAAAHGFMGNEYEKWVKANAEK